MTSEETAFSSLCKVIGQTVVSFSLSKPTVGGSWFFCDFEQSQRWYRFCYSKKSQKLPGSYVVRAMGDFFKQLADIEETFSKK
jgi:hypothetical protein